MPLHFEIACTAARRPELTWDWIFFEPSIPKSDLGLKIFRGRECAIWDSGAQTLMPKPKLILLLALLCTRLPARLSAVVVPSIGRSDCPNLVSVRRKTRTQRNISLKPEIEQPVDFQERPLSASCKLGPQLKPEYKTIGSTLQPETRHHSSLNLVLLRGVEEKHFYAIHQAILPVSDIYFPGSQMPGPEQREIWLVRLYVQFCNTT